MVVTTYQSIYYKLQKSVMYRVGPESTRAGLPGHVEKRRKVPINTNGLGKSKTDGITRPHAVRCFLHAHALWFRSVGSVDSARTSRPPHPATPSCASDSSNCIHHWILWIYSAALCAFLRNCQCIFIRCWCQCEFFRYISRCHFAYRTQDESVFVTEIQGSGFLKYL